MEKMMNEKTTCARLFNGLFREQSAKFVYRILLCFILLILIYYHDFSSTGTGSGFILGMEMEGIFVFD